MEPSIEGYLCKLEEKDKDKVWVMELRDHHDEDPTKAKDGIVDDEDLQARVTENSDSGYLSLKDF